MNEMNAPTPREQELEQEVKQLSEMLLNADPVYCPTCGHCGEEGCCGPMTKCKDATPNHCLYGQPRKPTQREQELEAQNKALWELVGKCEKTLIGLRVAYVDQCEESGVDHHKWRASWNGAALETLAAIQKAKESH
jgi:hypothetical protein